ncbi:hypothetical protein PRUPE_4G032400 [Prunus persica]|uniref:Uncharacterized protein n=1 Tax=Prunus persica TaxID=3760 RepID=A0A251PF38_PRUPE|nr:hypothetical protein PRUPE_4G032400 [Prunus persica]
MVEITSPSSNTLNNLEASTPIKHCPPVIGIQSITVMSLIHPNPIQFKMKNLTTTR